MKRASRWVRDEQQRVTRTVDDTRARLEEARPRSPWIDATFRAVEHDTSAGGAVIAGAVAFRIFLYLVPYIFVLVVGFGVAADAADEDPGDLAREAGIGGLVAKAVAARPTCRARTRQRARDRRVRALLRCPGVGQGPAGRVRDDLGRPAVEAQEDHQARAHGDPAHHDRARVRRPRRRRGRRGDRLRGHRLRPHNRRAVRVRSPGDVVPPTTHQRMDRARSRCAGLRDRRAGAPHRHRRLDRASAREQDRHLRRHRRRARDPVVGVPARPPHHRRRGARMPRCGSRVTSPMRPPAYRRARARHRSRPASAAPDAPDAPAANENREGTP